MARPNAKLSLPHGETRIRTNRMQDLTDAERERLSQHSLVEAHAMFAREVTALPGVLRVAKIEGDGSQIEGDGSQPDFIVYMRRVGSRDARQVFELEGRVKVSVRFWGVSTP